MANTKLDRIERDIEKTRAKILEYQKRLKDLEAQKIEEENAQIVQMVKAVHLDGAQLAAFLSAYASGEIALPQPDADYTDEQEETETSVYKGYKRDKIEMRGDRAEMSDFPLYLNMVAGGLDCRDQAIGGFSFVVKIYAVPVVEIIG